MNTSNSNGYVCRSRYCTSKYTDFKNKTAEIDAETIVCTFDSNVFHYMQQNIFKDNRLYLKEFYFQIILGASLLRK